MAGYKSTFGGNVDYAYSRGVTDLTGRLQGGAAQLMGAGKGLSAFVSQANSARQSIRAFSSEMADLKNRINQSTDPKEVARLTRQFEAARKSAEGLKRSLASMPFQALEKGIGNVTKGLISWNANILKMGFNFLIDSIKRVYELQERWAHAIGGFNMKLGGMTKGMQGATRAAVQWSSTIRGLTNGSIEEGIQMFGEFTMAIGRTVEAGDGFAKFGLQLARGFGIGGQGAGQIAKVFENIGMSADDAAEAMKTSIKAANAAGIPVNMLADDLSKSVTYMARFGKEGQKTLIQGAAYARKYDMTLQDLQKTVEGFDMFDEAAKSASKLNTAFGTMINSMDLMMEDDPAKRLEMIRQQMLAQGLTYDKLTPKQRRYFSETMKLSDEQTAALLDARNAGESYADFQAKAEKRQRDELNAKQMMQKMLVKTAQTMFAFGAAFDRVTMAIGRAIKPLLEVFGLAKSTDKEFKGFGSVMGGITDTVVKFFDTLAENEQWKDFMRELANDLIRAGKALKDFVFSGGAANLMGKVAGGMKTFYTYTRDLVIKLAPAMQPLLDAFLYLSKHLDKIVIAYGAIKGFGVVKDFASAFGLGGPGKGIMGGGTKVALTSGIAGAAGGLLGGGGAAIGGAIGGLLGPIGGLIGAVGGKLIEKISDWLGGEGKTELEKAKELLEEQIKKEEKVRESYTSVIDTATKNQEAQDRIRKSRNDVLRSMEEAAGKQLGKKLTLTDVEVEMIKSRGTQLSRFGKSSDMAKSVLDKLAGGVRTFTQEELKSLVTGASAYEVELGKLRDATKAQAELELANLQVSKLGQEKEAGEAMKRLNEQELKSLGVELDAAGGKFGDRSALGPMGEMQKIIAENQNLSNDERLKIFQKQQKIQGMHSEITAKDFKRVELEAKINKLTMDNTKAETDLIKKQTEYLKEQTKITLKSVLMGSTEYKDFLDTDAGKGPNAFENYLTANAIQLQERFGETGFKLLREKTDLSGVVAPVTAAPRRDSVFDSPYDFSQPAGGASAGSTTQVNVTTVLKVDSKDLVRTQVSPMFNNQ